MFDRNDNRVIGSFRDIASASAAIDELRAAGFDSSDIRLVDNEPLRMDGDASLADSHPERLTHRQGFFARLFGLDDEVYDEQRFDTARVDGRESDRFFTEAYSGGRQLLIVDAGDRAVLAKEILQRTGADIDERAPTYFNERLDDIRTLMLRGEELRATKESREAGEVRVRKEIVTETKTLEVPVTREEVVIERRAVRDGEITGEAGEIDASSLRDGEEIRIPLTEEEVHIEKRTVPREEVRIGKEQVQETRRVTEDLKREEARIERTGEAKIRDKAKRGRLEEDRPNL